MHNPRTMRWLLTFIIASIVLSAIVPHLARFGIGRIPGDFSVRIGGRDWHFPLGSAVLFSFLFWVIARWI
jgi:hypothetical protein